MKKISVIIPVFNEEKTIKEIIHLVKKVKLPLKKEIIVINDGSTDSSLDILKGMKAINLFSHNNNLGKGAAVRTGLKHATGDVIMVQDADLEYNPLQIPSLIQPILRNKAEIVYGSRFLNPDNENWKIPSHYIGNLALSLLIRIMYRCKITDVETCYKAFTKKVKNSVHLELNDFGFETEFTAKSCKKGFKIMDVPIRHYPRLWNAGKKINWKDGIKAFFYLIKFRLK